MRGLLLRLVLSIACAMPLLATTCGGCDAAHPALDLGNRCPPNAKCLPPTATLDCATIASVQDTTVTSHGVIAGGSSFRPARELTLTLRVPAKGRYRVTVNQTNPIHRMNGNLGSLDDLQPGVVIRAIGGAGGPDGAALIATNVYILRAARPTSPTTKP